MVRSVLHICFRSQMIQCSLTFYEVMSGSPVWIKFTITNSKDSSRIHDTFHRYHFCLACVKAKSTCACAIIEQPNQILQQTSEDREKRETNRNVVFLKKNIFILLLNNSDIPILAITTSFLKSWGIQCCPSLVRESNP